MTALGEQLIAAHDTLTPLLNEIAQMKLAYQAELREDHPDTDTLLAIKNRLRSLDSAVASRIVLA